MFKLSVALAICILAAMPAAGQSEGEMDALIESRLAYWKSQETAADSDLALIDAVFQKFLAAAKPNKRELVPAEVNNALAPIKSRYSDYRLNYLSLSDYCPVIRTLIDARTNRLNRKLESLNSQSLILKLSILWRKILVNKQISEILAKQVPDSDVSGPFYLAFSELQEDSTQDSWIDAGMEASGPSPLFTDCR